LAQQQALHQHIQQVLQTEITQYLDLLLPAAAAAADHGTAMQVVQVDQVAAVAQDQTAQDQTDLQAQMTAEIKIWADVALTVRVIQVVAELDLIAKAKIHTKAVVVVVQVAQALVQKMIAIKGCSTMVVLE
jgi:hypothetical protein